MELLTKIKLRIISNKKRIKYYEKQGVSFGKNCVIYPTTTFSTEPYLITIGDNFYTSSKVSFITHDGGVHVIKNMHPEYGSIGVYGKINIGNNVFAGINSTILYGTEIGDNVIIAAGAVCKGKYPNNCVIGGVPAKVICTIEEYNLKHIDNYILGGPAEEKKKRILDFYNNEDK